jgi:flagellar basal body L-ring protein FlgH
MLLAAPSLFASPWSKVKPHPKSPEQLREEYIARLQQQYVPAEEQATVGSLWTSEGRLGDFSSDYKARSLNDTITILASVQTTAAQSGSVDSERTLTSNSSITGLLGRTPGDIGPANTVPSSALSNLEIEMKGKGIIADGVRPPNPITKAILWLLNF